MFIAKRKRSRTVKLNNRFGSRRNRIMISLSLVFIVAGLYLNNAQNETSTYYLAAIGDLAPGSELSTGNLTSIKANLGEQSLYYLTDQDKVSGWFLNRSVHAGELIPKSALATSSATDCRAMKVGLTNPLASEVHLGDRLDIWAGEQNSATETIPAEIVSAAVLVDIESNPDALNQNSNTAELCVPLGQIRSVVNAIALREVIIGVKSD